MNRRHPEPEKEKGEHRSTADYYKLKPQAVEDLVTAGVVNYIKCVTLEAHLKYLEEQSAQGAGSLAAKSV